MLVHDVSIWMESIDTHNFEAPFCVFAAVVNEAPVKSEQTGPKE